MGKKQAFVTLGGMAILVLAIVITVGLLKSSGSVPSYLRFVSGPDIPGRVGYELVIAQFSMGNPDHVSQRMNIDRSRAAQLILESRDFLETRTRNQVGYRVDTCSRRDSIDTVDELIEEHRQWLSRNDEDVDRQIASLLSGLTTEEAGQLTHLAEEMRANSTGTDVDPGDFWRARGNIDVQEELSRICARPAP